MPDEMAESIVAPIETATAPAVAPLRTVPLKAVDPSGQDVAVARVVESPPVQTASLPQTASILPVDGPAVHGPRPVHEGVARFLTLSASASFIAGASVPAHQGRDEATHRLAVGIPIPSCSTRR